MRLTLRGGGKGAEKKQGGEKVSVHGVVPVLMCLA
jgi:hypothetical protein